MAETAPLTTALDTTSPVPVDSSSNLSPSSPTNLSSLESRLQRRPDPQDLLNRNILHSTSTSGTIQSQKDELKHAMIADNLKKGLAHRPERKELEERGILPDEHIAPSLVGQKKELEKNMLTDSLNTKLAHRPKVEDVVEKGILNADEDPRSPSQ